MYTIFSIAVIVVLLGAVSSRPQHSTELVPVVDQNFSISPEGGYSYNYETGNGIKATEVGEVRDVPSEDGTGREPAVVVTGSYSYSLDGTTYTVTYTADENGFRPTGEHIAPEIIKALEAIPQDNVGSSGTHIHPFFIVPYLKNNKLK